MKNNYPILLLIIGVITLSTFTGCQELVRQIPNWPVAENIEEIPGTYFDLEDDGIRTYLPQSFKRYNIEQYREVVQSSADSVLLAREIKLLENMRDDRSSNFYLFFDKKNSSSYILNTFPYSDFSRQDAQLLLGLIRKRREVQKNSRLKYEKRAAYYKETADVKYFKAVYKISNTKNNGDAFQQIYRMSTAARKTFQIILTTPFEVNFDPFVRKMKL